MDIKFFRHFAMMNQYFYKYNHIENEGKQRVFWFLRKEIEKSLGSCNRKLNKTFNDGQVPKKVANHQISHNINITFITIYTLQVVYNKVHYL